METETLPQGKGARGKGARGHGVGVPGLHSIKGFREQVVTMMKRLILRNNHDQMILLLMVTVWTGLEEVVEVSNELVVDDELSLGLVDNVSRDIAGKGSGYSSVGSFLPTKCTEQM